METLSKIQEPLGDDEVSTEEGYDSPWNYLKPKHIYEGTDSEDDEDIIKGRSESPKSYWNSPKAGVSEGLPDDPSETTLNDYQLTLGDLAPNGIRFCPWQTVKKYPYTFVGFANRSKVAEGFFDGSKLFERAWNFFYIHRYGSDSNLPAILLIPAEEFQAFLTIINQTLNTQLTMPSGGSRGVFRITFGNDGTPRPRYLGKSTTRDMAKNLHAAIPPRWFQAKGEVASVGSPSDLSLAAFKAKIDVLVQAQKGRRIFNKEKQKVERIAKQKSWNHTTKRVQRYLGIRQASNRKQAEIARAKSAGSDLEWREYHDALIAAIPRSADFDPDKPAPYEQEGEIVFVCVDVEANERSANQITEIGIATLDTRDLKYSVPGESGLNWHSKIRARHFRINEYKHIINSTFVSGCPDRFEFGQSEFINFKDAPHHVASCFKHPFSNPDEQAPDDENEPKRSIVLVGHSIGADITYLKTIGYDVHNLSNLQELVDTASMWQSLKRDTNPRNLGSVLAELNIVGWNLHNAGNDAVYTLQAMIGIAIRHLYERDKRKKAREQEKKVRVEEIVKEATQSVLERGEGWSSGEENSDGGLPVAPLAPRIKKSVPRPKEGAQQTQPPWRKSAQNSGMKAQNTRIDGSWVPAARPSNQLPASFEDWERGVLAEQKIWQGYASSSVSTPTDFVQTSSPESRDVEDLVKKTKLFTVERGESADEINRGGDEW